MRNKIKHPFEKAVQKPLRHVRFILLVSAGLLIGAAFALSPSEPDTASLAPHPAVYYFDPLGVRPDGSLPHAEKLSKQRELFVEVEQMLSRREFTRARETMLQLTDYPLFPYLEANLLENNLSLQNEGPILEFLHEHRGTPAERQLRTAWLQYHVRRNDANRFLRDYRPQSSAQLQCQYLRYRYQDVRGNDTELERFWQEVTAQWLHGRSLPSACDSVFANWAAAGNRTEQVVWRRIGLALNERQTSLARYLTRYMPENKQDLALLKRRIHANPSLVRRTQEFRDQDYREKEIILAALQRYRWQNHRATIQAWEAYLDKFQQHPFSVSEQQQMNEAIAVTLALRQEPDALVWFSKVDMRQADSTTQQWYLATLLKQQRYDLIHHFVINLPEAQRSAPQWTYWHARALIQLGFNDLGHAKLQQVAGERNYYGFLASARLALVPDLNHQELTYEPADLQAVATHPAALRAYEWRQLERFLDARREWNTLRTDITTEQQVLAAVVASEWGWHDQAIFAFAQNGALNDVHRRFPLAYRELLSGEAERAAVDPSWVFAIARRESSFQPDAVSPAGARGLMQVMPGTAEHLTRRSPGPMRNTTPRLDSPEDNVRLGTQYLAELLHRTDQNWILATAAYNAGINRVNEWLPAEPMPADLWVELIPFQETRDYVKAVLAYQQIYTMLLGNDANVLTPVVRMQINGNGRS